LNEIKLYASVCVLGGLLRVIASFLDYNSAAEAIEVLYITTDLCLILGLIGFYSVYRQNLFWLGHLGFSIAICSIAFIAGPEAKIFGTSAYQLGSPIIGIGLLLLSINLISAKLCGLVAPFSLIASVIIGLISTLLGNDFLFIVTGLLFGAGFTGLGIHVWQSS
jgi:hypothetical protein